MKVVHTAIHLRFHSLSYTSPHRLPFKVLIWQIWFDYLFWQITKPRYIFLVWRFSIQSKEKCWYVTLLYNITNSWGETPKSLSEFIGSCDEATLWQRPSETVTRKASMSDNNLQPGELKIYVLQNLSPWLQIKQLSLLLYSCNSTWKSCGAKAWLSVRKQALVFIGWFVSKSLCFRRIEFSTFSGVWTAGIQTTKINFLWDSGQIS